MSRGVRQQCANRLRRHLENPFLVLELTPVASRQDVERHGQKLLSLLALGTPGSDRYPTPLGPRARTQESVRAALAELRDPERRLEHEWWSR